MRRALATFVAAWYLGVMVPMIIFGTGIGILPVLTIPVAIVLLAVVHLLTRGFSTFVYVAGLVTICVLADLTFRIGELT